MSFRSKICNFISLYPSPSQSHDVFEIFVDNLKLTLDRLAIEKPYLKAIIGEFTVKSSSWYKHDETKSEGFKIEAVTFKFGLQQLIQESIHILSNSSFCIDLIFMSQPNLVMKSVIHSALHENSHLKLIWKCHILHLMNVRYGLGKNHLEIFALMKWSNNLIKISKIFSKMTFPMKQLLLRIETHLGLTTRLSG